MMENPSFTMMRTRVVITRFVCANLLHFKLMAEVRQALTMMKFYYNHSTKFELKEPEKSEELKALELENEVVESPDNKLDEQFNI